MRLTNSLLYFVKRYHIPGKIDIGKNRIHKIVTCARKKKAMTQMVAEQRNMDILEKPYISEEEDYRHEWDMGLFREKWDKQKKELIESKWLKDRHMGDSYRILELSRKWE